MKLRKISSDLAFNKSKRANVVLDIATVIVVLVVLAIVAIFSYSVFDDVNTDIQNDDDINQEYKEDVNDLHTQYPGILDGIFITVFLFLWLAVMLSVFAIDSHPVFFIFAILLLGFVIFLGAVMSNTYAEITAEDDFVTYADAFPMSNFIMDKLPYAVVAIGASVLLVLYAKSRL